MAKYCTAFPDDFSKCETLIIAKRAVASLSLIGCIFMLFLIWLFKKYQYLTERLIFYLTIAALLDSVAYIVGGVREDGPQCEFEAFFLSFFDWSVLLWVLCIVFNLYFNLRMMKTDRFEKFYHVICWGLASVMSVLPFISDVYGPSGVWCWIGSEYTVWRFATWYVPLFLLICLMFGMYLYIRVTVQKTVRTWEGFYDPDTERKRQMMSEEIKPLVIYPFIYLGLSLFPLIDRIENAFSHHAVFWLVLIHVICSPLLGACNAIAYAVDREMLSRLNWQSIRTAWQTRNNPSAVIREYPTYPGNIDNSEDTLHANL